MKGSDRVIRFGSMAALVVLVAACADGQEPAGVQAETLVPSEATADAMNPRQAEGPVWEAVLTPLNAHATRQAVTGKATLTMDGDELTVMLDVKGVVPGHLHPQHIHGHDGVSTCPTPRADANGDGFVSVGEGAPNYGPVLVPLTAFPTPDGSRYHYEQTFTGQGGLEPERRAIVVHGTFVDGAYDASMPVACGTVERVR